MVPISLRWRMEKPILRDEGVVTTGILVQNVEWRGKDSPWHVVAGGANADLPRRRMGYRSFTLTKGVRGEPGTITRTPHLLLQCRTQAMSFQDPQIPFQRMGKE